MRRAAPPDVQALARLLLDLYGPVRAARMLDVHHVTAERMATGERVLPGSIRLAQDRLALYQRGGIAALEAFIGDLDEGEAP